MTNSNLSQREIQTTNLGIMIGRYLLDCQLEGPDRHPANICCSYSRYTKTKAIMHLRNIKGKKGREKTTKKKSTVILKTILRKEDLENGWWKSEQNPLNLIQVKDLLTESR